MRETLSSLSRSCSWRRKPSLGWMSRRERTRARASVSDIPRLIIRKARAQVAERDTPIKQWTSTRPEDVFNCIKERFFLELLCLEEPAFFLTYVGIYRKQTYYDLGIIRVKAKIPTTRRSCVSRVSSEYKTFLGNLQSLISLVLNCRPFLKTHPKIWLAQCHLSSAILWWYILV